MSMNVSTQHDRPGDGGFTVVELVIAAFVMFFVLTALLGLVATTSQMASRSRARAVLTDVTSGRLDLYRTYAFKDIQVTSKGGKIPDTETLVVSGWTINLASTVASSTTYPGTVNVTIVATASHISLPTVTYTAAAALRGPFGSGSAVSTGTSTLTLEFAPGSPNANDTVSDSSDNTLGSVLQILAKATSTANKIAAFQFKVNTGTLDIFLTDVNGVQSTYQALALSPPQSSPFTSASFVWNVGQVPLGSGTYPIPDGMRTVSMWVQDDHGNITGPIQRTVFVDNKDPNVPTGLLVSPVQTMSGSTPALSVSSSWANAYDGTDLVAGYAANLYRDQRTNALSAPTPSKVLGLPNMTLCNGSPYATSPSAAIADAGFSRYVLQAQSIGGGALGRKSVWAASNVAYTPPIITGSGTQSTNGNYNIVYAASLPVPAPQYPVSAVTSIQVQRTCNGTTSYSTLSAAQLTAAKTAWNGGTAYTVTDSFQQAVGSKQGVASDVTYRVVVTLTPSGYDSTAKTLTSSSVLLHSVTKFMQLPATLTATTPSW